MDLKCEEMEDSDRFLYPKEDFEQTPSMVDGISAKQELTYRQKLAMLMQTIGIKSGLSQLAVNTSVIYMHRFFMYRSVKKMHRVHIGVAFVFAAGKVEESARKLEYLIRTAVEIIRTNKNRDYMDKNDELTYRMDCEWKSRMDTLVQSNCNIESTAYLEMRKIVLDYEIEIYSVMGFHLQVIHPHNYVIRMCAMLGAENIKDISQYAYNLATASSQLTMMCLKYKPDLIATVCLNIASIAHNVKFVSMKNETIHWFQVHNPATELTVVQSVTEEFMNVIKDCSLLPTWMASLAKNGRVNTRPIQGPSRAPGTSTSSAPVSRQPPTAPQGASQPTTQRVPPASSHSGGDSSHNLPPAQAGDGSASDNTPSSQGHNNGQHRSQTSSSGGMRPPHSSRPHPNQPHHRSQPPHGAQHHPRTSSAPATAPGALPTTRPQQPRTQQPIAPGRPSSHPVPPQQQRPQPRQSHSDHRHAQPHPRPTDHRRSYPYTDSDRHSRQTANLPALAPDGRSPHTPAHSPPSSPPAQPRPPSPQPELTLPQATITEEQKPTVPKLSLRDYRARVKPSSSHGHDQPDALFTENSQESLSATNSPLNPDMSRAVRQQPSASQTASPFGLPAADSNPKLPGLKIKIRPPKSTPSPAGPSSRNSTPREEGEISDSTDRKEGGLGIRIKLPVPKSESHSRDSNGSGDSSHRHHHSQHREHRHKEHREHHKHKKHRHSSSSRHSEGGKSSKRHSSAEFSTHDAQRPAKQARSDTAIAGYSHRELQHQNSGFSINDAFTSTMPTNIFDCDSDEDDSQAFPPVTPDPPHHQRFHQLMAQHRANGTGNPPLPPISRSRGPPPPPPPPPSSNIPPPPPSAF